jgi:hypothetical protein
MGEISLEIQDYLAEGMHPVLVAKILGVPLSWVYDTLESMQEDDDSYSPFNTVNS